METSAQPYTGETPICYNKLYIMAVAVIGAIVVLNLAHATGLRDDVLDFYASSPPGLLRVVALPSAIGQSGFSSLRQLPGGYHCGTQPAPPAVRNVAVGSLSGRTRTKNFSKDVTSAPRGAPITPPLQPYQGSPDHALGTMTHFEPKAETEHPTKLRSAAVKALQRAARQNDPREFDRLTRHALRLLQQARAIRYGLRPPTGGTAVLR
jgi:hypothetical protein